MSWEYPDIKEITALSQVWMLEFNYVKYYHKKKISWNAEPKGSDPSDFGKQIYMNPCY